MSGTLYAIVSLGPRPPAWIAFSIAFRCVILEAIYAVWRRDYSIVCLDLIFQGIQFMHVALAERLSSIYCGG